MAAKVFHLGYLGWIFGSLQRLSSFGTSSAKQPGKAFCLKQFMNCFGSNRVAFAQKDFLDLGDGVVLFSELDNARFTLECRGTRFLRTFEQGAKESRQSASLEISAQGIDGVYRVAELASNLLCAEPIDETSSQSLVASVHRISGFEEEDLRQGA